MVAAVSRVRERYRWEATLEPLVRFVATAAPAADSGRTAPPRPGWGGRQRQHGVAADLRRAWRLIRRGQGGALLEKAQRAGATTDAERERAVSGTVSPCAAREGRHGHDRQQDQVTAIEPPGGCESGATRHLRVGRVRADDIANSARGRIRPLGSDQDDRDGGGQGAQSVAVLRRRRGHLGAIERDPCGHHRADVHGDR